MTTTSILSPAGAAALDEVARARAVLAFDFDGTLAPLVDDRSAAAMRPETRTLLRAVALLYPSAVVSGRARADVASRVAGLPLVAVIGNHGAEPGFGPVDRVLRRRVGAWRDGLAAALAGAEVEIEDKALGLALHYRHARSWREAERRAIAAAESLEGARIIGGHAVVNVVPADAPTKGDAIRWLCGRVSAPFALYVGDDRTDEEAFRADAVRVAISVGEEPGSSARWSLARQQEVDDLLRALLAARARLDGRGGWEGLVRAVRR